MNFSPDQAKALEVMETGKNCFLTGKAGTGKSSITKEFIRWCEDNDKSIIVCASTGAAAQGLSEFGACTIHRAFSLRAKSIIGLPKKPTKEIEAADIIIIDEISMCRIDLFEHIATAVKMVNANREHDANIIARKTGTEPDYKPIQLIVVGDFTQLRPVVTKDDANAMRAMYGSKVFAFESKLWKEMNFENLSLIEVHRQEKDQEYAEHLNEIRRCKKDPDPFADSDTLDWFNLNTAKTPFNNEECINLCGKNVTASEENRMRLEELPGETYTSTAEIKGEADMSSVNAEYELTYKIGAKVMMLTNGNGYHNGSIGIIKKVVDSIFDDEEMVVIEIDGTDVYVGKNKWVVYKPTVKEEIIQEVDKFGQPVKKTKKTVENKEAGQVIQYPFKLGYAVTIHKAQGMTLTNGVNLKPEIWDSGQLYVALSRVDCRENIYIDGVLKDKNWKLDKKVEKFYQNFDEEWKE